MTKCFGYARLSAATDSSTSIERQTQKIAQAAELQGMELVEIFTDVGLSGFSGVDRPGLNALMSRLDEVDAVFIWRLDRLGRRTSALLSDVEEMNRANVSLISIQESLDFGGPVGKFLVTMLSALAEMESANISTRVKESQRHLAAVGRWRGGVAPYGWRPTPILDGGFRLSLDPDTAPVLREIVDRVIEGEAVSRCLRDLTERGVPSPRVDKRWHTTSVLGMLRSTNLIGSQDGIATEQLIEPSKFTKLQDVLGSRTKKRPSRKDSAKLLSGLMRCGSCGAPMHLNKAGTDRVVTRCFYVPVDADPCPQRASVGYPKLEQYVIETWLATLSRVEIMERIKPGPNLVEEQRARAVMDRDQLAQQLARGEISSQTFAAASTALDPIIDAPDTTVSEAPLYRPTGEVYGDVWDRSDLNARRKILADTIEAITIHPGRLPIEEKATITWATEIGPITIRVGNRLLF